MSQLERGWSASRIESFDSWIAGTFVWAVVSRSSAGLQPWLKLMGQDRSHKRHAENGICRLVSLAYNVATIEK